MYNPGIIILLKTFTKKEIGEFDKFLRSPYFTEGKNIRHKILYSYFLILRRFYPGFEKSDLLKEDAFRQLYPHKEYNDTTMRKLNSDLLKLAEKFLVQIELEKNENIKKRYLLIQLNERKTEKHYKSVFNDMLKFLNSAGKDEEYYYEIYNTWKNYYSFYFTRKNIYKLSEPIDNTGNYSVYVIMASLSIYLWILSYSRTSSKTTIPSFFTDVLSHVENNYHMYVNNPQIVVYFNMIMLVSSRNEKYFVLLKNLKSKYYDVLSTLDRNNLFTMMTNFCHDKILGGNFNYRTERFRLDNEYLRKELYNVLGEFHISYFMAIAKNAVKLKKFKWAEDFKNKYSGKLNSENRGFAINYIQAEIVFTKGDFGKAIELLSRLKLKQSNHKQYTRNLMIQVYFETHDEEALRSLLDTGRHFLHHDRYLSDTAKENSSNFMRFTEKLVNLKLHGKVTEIAILKKNIIKSSNVQNKDWLLEKIDEIEHK